MNAMVLDDYLDALLGSDAAAGARPASPTLATDADTEDTGHTDAAITMMPMQQAAVPPPPVAQAGPSQATAAAAIAPATAEAEAAPRALAPLPPALPAQPLLAGQMPARAALSPHLLPPPGDVASAHFRPLAEPTTRWLRMRCDQQQYALELLKVQEVVLPSTLLPLRGGAPHLLGVMNLRGQVVPVIDMGLFLGRAAVTIDSHSRIVVLEESGEVLGLQVSAVEDVANIAAANIEPPDHARICRISNHLFRGVARLGKQTVILLDASQLLA